jgi:hypothetical protein
VAVVVQKSVRIRRFAIGVIMIIKNDTTFGDDEQVRPEGVEHTAIYIEVANFINNLAIYGKNQSE